MRPGFTALIFISGIIILHVIIFLTYTIVMRLIFGKPKNNPKQFLRRNKNKLLHDEQKKRIVFVGDSITHGILSVNYIKMIAKELGKSKFYYINAGINSHLAYNVLMRIDEIVACNPAYITIMIGTNDAHREMKLYKETRSSKRINLPREPTKEWYKENLLKIITILQKKTNAKLAICSIPPIGENMNHPIFKQSIEYSKLIKEIAEKRDLVYLPVNEKQIAFLKANPSKPKHEPEHMLYETTAAKYFLLGHSFDKMSKHYGFNLLVDHLHLNSRGAKIVADLIVGFILSQDSS
ncbi:MAG: hypothetical protein HZR80_15545 [Candidatus Heimdallarchaeota archaeon]